MASPKKKRMRRRLMLQRLQAQQEPVAEVVVEKSVPAPEAPQEVKASRDKPAPRSWEKKEKKGKK